MSTASAVVSAILALMLTFAAARKLSHRSDVVASYARVGVPEDRLDLLAGILLAGAGGLALGLAWAPLGVAAGAALTLYFLLAVAAHIRAGDAANLPVPAVMLALAVAVLVTRIAA